MKTKFWSMSAAVAVCSFTMQALAQSRPPVPLSPEALLNKTAIGQREHLSALMAEAAGHVRRAVATTDVTGPVLTAFDAKSIDVSAHGARLSAAIRATDEESGVQLVWASGYGPHRQYVSLNLYAIPPDRRLSGLASANGSTPFHEPGQYVFTSACAYDQAGNAACYDEEGLAALGNNRMTVLNRRGYDVTLPVLVSGRILTPWLSLSQPHPGTSEPSFAGIELELQDAGDSALAGALYATAMFCQKGGFPCFSLPGYHLGMPRLSHTRYRTGVQLSAGDVEPGEYRLANLTVADHAGMERSYQSLEFGGDTDFGAYFPSVSIRVRP